MMGEEVTVYRREKTGEDSMGEPVYEWAAERVEGCLVRPLAGSDLSDPARPDGVRASYSVALPKTYTAGMAPLAHARVSLTGRGMADDAATALRVVGEPDVTRPCPTAWDIVVSLGRVDG